MREEKHQLIEEKHQLREEKRQLREKEEQLREKEIILLKKNFQAEDQKDEEKGEDGDKLAPEDELPPKKKRKESTPRLILLRQTSRGMKW